MVEAGGDRLALPAGDVAEVLRPRRLSRVPRAPAVFLGVASLRGAVLPVLSLALLRGAERPGAQARPAARVVVMAGDPPFGLAVDAVEGFGDGADLPCVDAAALASRAVGAVGAPRAPSSRGVAAPPAPSAPRPARAVLGFAVAGQLFGLDLGDVVGVEPVPVAVAVPDAGAAVLGVAARRGALLPLVSARALLGRPEAEAGRGRVVVVRVAGADLGLVVDGLDAILRVPDEAVDPLPAFLARDAATARVAAVCRLDGGRRLLSLLAADRLLDDDAMRRALAAAPAPAVAEAEPDGAAAPGAGDERFVVFAAGGEPYALPVASVVEVVRFPDALARVPRAPPFLMGAMSLRGSAVPVIDAALRFGAGVAPAGARRRVLVVDVGGSAVGLTVDAVSDVLSAAPGDLQPAPDLAGDGTFDRVLSAARHGGLVLVADPRALFAEAGRDMAAALAGEGAPP